MKSLKFIFITVFFFSFFNISLVFAATGTIDAVYHNAKFTTGHATILAHPDVNTLWTGPGAAITVSDSELTGYMWSEAFGPINLNCSNTGSCGSFNYKVAVDSTTCGVPATLSGYGFSSGAGWANFGPHASGASQLTIDTNGEWNGFVWLNGWIEFSCSPAGKIAGKCTTTTWRPPVCGTTTTTTGTGSTGVVIPTSTTGTGTGTPTTSTTGTGTGTPTTTTTTGTGTGTGTPTTGANSSTTTGSTSTSSTTSGSIGTSSTSGGTSGFVTGLFSSTTGGFIGTVSSSGSSSSTSSTNSGTSTSSTPINNTSTQKLFVPNPKISKITSADKISIGAAITGTITTLSSMVAVNPLSIKDIALLPFRLWTSFLFIVGLRRKPWGIVYDAKTKRPIDPAYVTLYDQNHVELESTITDMEGRFGFKVKKGSYYLSAKKTNYIFPSMILSGQSKDDVYDSLNFGQIIVVEKDNQLITQNIPMDPIQADWNQEEKNRMSGKSILIKNIIARILNLFFWIGFIMTTISVYITPSIWHGIMFCVYVLLFILSEFGLPSKSSMGAVVNSTDETPVVSALVKIYSNLTNTLISKKVTDNEGKYYALINNGEYYATVQKQKLDLTYGDVVHTTEKIEVKKGVLSHEIKL